MITATALTWAPPRRTALQLGRDAPRSTELQLGRDDPRSTELQPGRDAPRSTELQPGRDAPRSTELQPGRDAPRSTELQLGPGAAAETVELSATVAAGEVVDVSRMRHASSVLRLLATLLRPRSGQLLVSGVDAIREPLAARRRLAYVSPDTPLPEGLTVGEYVSFLARARGQAASRAAESLERFGLDTGQRLSRLDADRQQRARLAGAAATGADVLLLDRPFHALDESGRGVTLEWLRGLRDAGASIAVCGAALADLAARQIAPRVEHVA